MTLAADLAARRNDRYLALILDNEVTVGKFVTQPPLHWTRCIQRDELFQVAEGYPTLLTEAQATLEMRNWDDVSSRAIIAALPALGESVDYIIFGNNAGQGLPLAQSLSRNLIAERAAVIYAESLPQMSRYQQLGFRNFFRRSEAAERLVDLAKKSQRPLELLFINTIQHDETNYHDP
ncbi:MAG TPA: hypothetical protein VFS81_02890 [Candidatus Binatia bacterium]|nr:hypothetical protein [Candidatus Binatia bacterium]